MEKKQKKLINTLKGVIASKIYKIANKNNISLEDALDKYIKDLPKSSRMRSYDILGAKEEIIAKANSKMSNGLSKIPANTKVQSVQSEKVDAPTAEVPVDAPTAEVPIDESKLKYPKPKFIKVDGEAKLVKNEDGYTVERTDKTRMVGLKCPVGTTPKKIDSDRAGCCFD